MAAFRTLFFSLALTLGIFVVSSASANSILDELENKAQSGDPNAQYYLATVSRYGVTRFEDGSEPPRDMKKAVNLLESLTRYKGEHEILFQASAHLELGDIYFTGDNIDAENAQESPNWWNAVGHLLKIDPPNNSEMSDPYIAIYKRSRLLLGLIYLRKEDLFRDYLSLKDADGPPENYARAASFFSEAEAKELPKASYHLACLYAKGLGVVQNYEKARSMLTTLAEDGYRDAPYPLGIISLEMKDQVNAHMWFNIASAVDNSFVKDKAREIRDSLSREMSASDVSKAQQQATKWIEDNPM